MILRGSSVVRLVVAIFSKYFTFNSPSHHFQSHSLKYKQPQMIAINIKINQPKSFARRKCNLLCMCKYINVCTSVHRCNRIFYVFFISYLFYNIIDYKRFVAYFSLNLLQILKQANPYCNYCGNCQFRNSSQIVGGAATKMPSNGFYIFISVFFLVSFLHTFGKYQ